MWRYRPFTGMGTGVVQFVECVEAVVGLMPLKHSSAFVVLSIDNGIVVMACVGCGRMWRNRLCWGVPMVLEPDAPAIGIA